MRKLGKILIVEDDRSTRFLIKNLLERLGFFVDDFSDGGSVFSNQVSLASYCLFLVDLQIGSLNGIQVIKRLRAKDLEQPIIVISGSIVHQDRLDALAAGCDEFLSKPFTLRKLQEVLQIHLPELEQDITEYDSSLHSEAFSKIKEEYRAGLGERVKELAVLVNDLKYEEVASLAHKMSSGGMFGYTEVSECCKNIVRVAKDSDAEALRDLMGDLESVVSDILG